MSRRVYGVLGAGLCLQIFAGCALERTRESSSADSQSNVAAAEALGIGVPKSIAGGIEFYSPSNLSPAVEQTIDGSRYELAPLSFPREKVADFQIPGTDQTGTPKVLQGIWWMDGNAACSCTVSFANVDFSAKEPIMSNFSENNFSYQGGKPPAGPGQKGEPSYETGIKSFHSAAMTNSIYEFHFKGEGATRYDLAEIMPVMKISILGVPLSLRVKPSLIKFGFKKVNEDMYLRENFVFGIKAPGSAGQYHFKRILKPSTTHPGQLEKTAYWEEFVGPNTGKKTLPPAMLRLPRFENPQ